MSARNRAGLVYFMKPAGLDGPIKIGFSWCPENRLIELSAWSPWPLEVIGSVKTTSKDERLLHACFADCHSHREWFHSTPRLRETINKILAAGSIDAVRGDLKPIGSIRRPRIGSPETARRGSYRMRIFWVCRKMDIASGGTCYFRTPSDVTAIIDRWHAGWRRKPQPPTADEIARLEAFISNPVDVVRHERKLKVVA
jgi:Meiotically up-regulated gene 113